MIVDNLDFSFEERQSKIQDLHFSYLDNMFSQKNIIVNNSSLKSLNIINLDNYYTNLGLLLSDECPFSIKCAIFEGTNVLKFKDRKEFSGSLLKQVNDVNEYINIYNKISGEIIDLKRIDTRDYPVYAIREAILNAVIHRDYNYSGSILISLYDDRIEITSLGGLVKGLEIKDLYLGISQTRNKNLANVFYRLEYVECFGTGIKRIMDSYDIYLKKPKLLCTNNTFKVTLYNVNYEEKKEDNGILSNLSQEEIIVEYLKNNDSITRCIVEKMLNISTSRAKEIIKSMIDKNIIESCGMGKKTYYILKK